MGTTDATLDGSGPGFAGESSSGDFGPDAPPVVDWDRYEIERSLGHGGMGSVYQARDLLLGRPVALKFIRGGDPKLAMRLLREARAQARIDHQGVCKVYEVGEVDQKHYIAMELVRGRPLG